MDTERYFLSVISACEAKWSHSFRKAGYQAIDRICDYYNSLQERSVVPNVEPGYLRDHIPGKCPFTGNDWDI